MVLAVLIERLHKAFNQAIHEYNYQGEFKGVFPVKCNQQRHVVEELITCGKKWDFGLEAGSKAELLIALSLIENPKALLICNGYKDRRYIETAILGRQLGRQPVVVIEQLGEVERIIAASKDTRLLPIAVVNAFLIKP